MQNLKRDKYETTKQNANSGLQPGSANLYRDQKPPRTKTALEAMREAADSLHSSKTECQIFYD